jgi:hypothetical protein
MLAVCVAIVGRWLRSLDTPDRVRPTDPLGVLSGSLS